MTETLYAGDAAWQDWFRICSVAGCPAEWQGPLSAEIRSAMYGRLAKAGFSREEAGEEDPVLFFDGYFKLKGSREKGKPLKLYFAHRIRTEGIRLFDFVCGTLFGAVSGRIHDIVIDWIAHLKGWTPHTLRDKDGRRRIVWEGASEEELDELGLPVATDELDLLDIAPMRAEIQQAISSVAAKIKAEKTKVGLLLYATAQDVSLTEAKILGGLGTAKSRAYALRDKVIGMLRKELKGCEGVDSPLFGRLLLEECEILANEALRVEEGTGSC